MKIKKDKFSKNRGGYSRLLDISCESCDTHLCYYQKDGPGILKRMYLDRIIYLPTDSKNLTCPNCKDLLGVLYIYQKENRPAYRLFVGEVKKKVVKNSKIF